MIEHVYRRAAAATSVSSVIVATDDERILDAVEAFGGDARMTSRRIIRAAPIGSPKSPPSSTCDIVVNVQGDEPLIEPAMIDEAVAPLLADPTLRDEHAAPAHRRPGRSRTIPNVTKVVVDRDGYALYFSRAPIPFTRAGCPPAPAWRHVGLYVYRRDCLLRLAALPPTALERSEALEQLRALEHGIRIKAVETQLRLDRRRHAGRSRARRDALLDASGALHDSVSDACAQHGTPTTAREIHPRDRRRRLVARQGPRRRLDRRAARRPRLQGRAAEVRPVHQRRPRHDEPVPARRGLRHRRRRRDGPRPRPLRALHQPGHDPATTTGRPARSTCRSSRRSGAATTSGAPSRSSRTSPTRSRTASGPSRTTSTSSSSRSAAPSATSRACRSSRRSASCARTSAARTRSTST